MTNNRTKRIGASEIAAVAGFSKWATPLDIWERKTGRAEEFEGNVFTEMGHELEPIVARQFLKRRPEYEMVEFKDDNGKEIPMFHPDYPFIGVQPDRGLMIGGKMVGNLECKTTIANWDAESIPLEYFAQSQLQAGIMRLNGHPIEEIYIAVLKSYYDFFYAPFEFNQTFFDDLVGLAVRFWEDYVLTDTPPPPVNSGDILRSGNAVYGSLEATPEIFATANELSSVKKEIKELEGKKDELEEAIKMILQEKDVLSYEGKVLATWKERKGATRVDVNMLKENFASVYDMVAKAGDPGRTFLLKI